MQEDALGKYRWSALLKHLETKRFTFTFTRIVAELEAMKQEVNEKPESFASRFAFLLEELKQRCPPGEVYSGKR